MRRIVPWLLLFGAYALEAAEYPSWFPLQAGQRWIYDSVRQDGDRRNPDVSRWTATVTVQEQIPTPEGLIIVRAVTLEGAPNPPGGWTWERVPLLVRNDCVVPLSPEAWNLQSRTFTPMFAAYVRQISPMFCFPMQIGATWKGFGDRTWTVDGVGPASTGPQDITPSAFRLKSDESGSTEYVWFERGVGPVASWSWHNGSYTEGFEKLRRQ